MNLRLIAAALILLGGVPPTAAEDVKPGLWKISVEARVPATPGWQPDPYAASQCLTEAEARHPERWLAGAGAGAMGCDFQNREMTGNSLGFDFSCGGFLGLKGHGQATYSATRMVGQLEVSFTDQTQGGQPTAMQARIWADYQGDCPAAGIAPAAMIPAGAIPMPPPGASGVPGQAGGAAALTPPPLPAN